MSKLRYKSEEALLESLFNRLIEDDEGLSVIILDTNTGDFIAEDGRIIHFASLQVAELTEYNKLKSVNLEENATMFNIKLKGYNQESIQHLIGSTLVLDEKFQLIFSKNKGRIIGFDFKVDIDEVI